VRDEDQLRESIDSASGRIEAMAVAGDDAETIRISEMLRALGVTYVALPGEMQSPPLLWRHGGGAFLDMMVSSR
jgi:hypothetical protein